METCPTTDELLSAHDALQALENGDWDTAAVTREHGIERLHEIGSTFHRFGNEVESIESLRDKFFHLFRWGPPGLLPADVLTAITGTDEEYHDFLRAQIRRTPEAVWRKPALCAELLSADEHRALLKKEIWYNADAAPHFNKFVGYLEPEHQVKYAKVVLRNKKELTPAQVAAMAERNLVSVSELRETMRDIVDKNESLGFFDGLAHAGINRRKLQHNTPEDNDRAIKKSLRWTQKLLDYGIVTADEIAAYMRRCTSPYNGKQQNLDTHYATESFIAEAVLMRYGIIPEPEPLHDRYARFAQKTQAHTNYNFTKAVNAFIELGLVKREAELQSLADIWDTLNKDCKWWLVEEFKKHLPEQAPALVEHFGQELMAEAQHDTDFEWSYETFRFMLSEPSIPPATKIDLLESYFAQEDHFLSISDEPAAFRELYETDPERCRRLAASEFKTVDQYRFLKLSAQDWMDFAGVSAEEIRNRQYEFASANLDSLTSHLEVAGRHPERSVLTLEDCLELVRSSSDFDESSYAHYFLRVVQGFALAFGSQSVQNLYEQVIDQIPRENIVWLINLGIGSYCPQIYDKVVEIITAGDYYSKLDLLYIPNAWESHVPAQLLPQLIDWAFANLSTMDLVQTSYWMWPHLNEIRREELFERLLTNPVEAEVQLNEPYIAEMFKETSLSRQLPATDTSVVINPQAVKTVQRRIKRYEHDKPGRVRLLSQYSYHHELARLVAASRLGANSSALIRHFNGHRDDRTELHALELLTLLASHTELESDEVISLTRREATVAAWHGLGQKFGLDETQSDRVLQTLLDTRVDPDKFAMWLHGSLNSQEVTTYFDHYLHFLAEGGSHLDWKFRAQAQDDLAFLNHDQLATWQAETAETVLIAGQPFTFRLTHGLDAIYQLGARPTYNCLHYAYGMNKRGLTSLLDPNVKVLHIENVKGKPVANAILRVGSFNGQRVLAQEPFYQSTNDSYTSRELMRISSEILSRHAQAMQMQYGLVGHNYHSSMIAAIQGRFAVQKLVNNRSHAILPKNNAPYTYSDASGVGQRALKVYFQPLVLAS